MIDRRLIFLGKTLRKKPTKAEQLLWRHLRMKQMEGLRFRRQQPIDMYIVDFVCFEKRLVIEVDGGQHATAGVYDKGRDEYLRQAGFQVLRFWNNEVMRNTEGVLTMIRAACFDAPSP